MKRLILLYALLGSSVALGSSPASPTPAATYAPADTSICEELRDLLQETLESPSELTTVPFVDSPTGGTGFACQATVTGTGETFGLFFEVANRIQEALTATGWTVDERYYADGATGTALGLNRDGVLALITVEWTPADGANCPEDRPIFLCNVPRAQQDYTITISAAQSSQGQRQGQRQGGSPIEDNPATLSARQNLAQRLSSDPSDITLVSVEAVEWPDACLGISSPDMMCAQMITPGYRITLEAGGTTYVYHTDRTGRSVILNTQPSLHLPGERQ